MSWHRHTQMQEMGVAVHNRPHCPVWARDEGALCWCGVFGNSRDPGTLLKVSRPPGTNSGEHHQDRFKETGVSALSSALWRVAGWEELQRARCCRWPVRGCFRLHAARASTSRDKPPPLGQDPGQHTAPKHLCLIDTSDNRARTFLMTRRPPISDQCSSCSSARKLSLYMYLPRRGASTSDPCLPHPKRVHR